MGAGTADTAGIRRKTNHREAELYDKNTKRAIMVSLFLSCDDTLSKIRQKSAKYAETF